MKKWIILLAAGLLGMCNVGCLAQVWDPDPAVRAQQLLLQSQQLQQTKQDWFRVMLLSQPTALDPANTSGVIGP
jgi:hypothetical protein